MKKSITFIFLLLLQLFVLASEVEYFTLSANSDKGIDISLEKTEKNIINAELYRVEKNSEPVVIFEFAPNESTFTDLSEPGTCYFLKIYFEDSTTKVTEKKCYSKTALFKKVNVSMLALFLILVISMIIPLFFNNYFFNNITSQYSGIMEHIALMIEEGCGKIKSVSSSDNNNSPLNYLSSSLIKKLPAVKESSEFESQVSIGIHISDGTASSNYDSYFHPANKKRISFSSSVSGVVSDSILGRKSLISIEPFVLESQISSKTKSKKLKPSGAYLFIIAVSFIIIAGSLLSTLHTFFPLIKMTTFLFWGDK